MVRDDGDVEAFLVRHIVQAIERRDERDSSIGVVADEIKPFFQSNVGISAWGLAIHAQARILATSSNAHEVRVFKFGLLRTNDLAETQDGDMSDADEDEMEETKGRKTDVIHHVLNGGSNIPYIAFCNTGDDPEGRWLLTTDISGVCRVMDLHELRPVQAFRFGRSFATQHSGGFDRLNAGWAVMFLDRRSFQPAEHTWDACALPGLEELRPGVKRNPRILDLSRTVNRLPESSEPLVYHRSKRRESDFRPLDAHSFEDESIDSAMADTHEEDADSDSESDGGAGVEIEIEVSDRSDEDEDEIEALEGGNEENPSTIRAQQLSGELEVEGIEYHELGERFSRPFRRR